MSTDIAGDGGSLSGGNTCGELQKLHENHLSSPNLVPSSSASNSNESIDTSPQQRPPAARKKRNLPGNPDPTAEVIALSPKSLQTTNRFVCEICNKGFQRDQNLQLHRRGHSLPWKLKQKVVGGEAPRRRVYVCPEPSCIHHHPARALGDLTGIKKHFSRKHGEKKWKCDKCPKKYAVQSDWKAHSKICGTKEYKCDCGTVFSRRDSFITHKAFCDALAGENNKAAIPSPMLSSVTNINGVENNHQISMPNLLMTNPNYLDASAMSSEYSQLDMKNPTISLPPRPLNLAGIEFPTSSSENLFGSPRMVISPPNGTSSTASSCLQLGTSTSSCSPAAAHMSATALLQKAAQMGAAASRDHDHVISSPIMLKGFVTTMAAATSFSTTGTFDHIQSQTNPVQSQLSGMTSNDSLVSQFMQKGPQHDQIPKANPQFFDTIIGAAGSNKMMMNQMDQMFADEGLFINQSQALLRNMDQCDYINTTANKSNGILQGNHHGPNNNLSAPFSSGVVGSSIGDTMTVDFLGIGGLMKPRILHDHNHQDQQLHEGMEFAAAFRNDQTVQRLSSFR